MARFLDSLELELEDMGCSVRCESVCSTIRCGVGLLEGGVSIQLQSNFRSEIDLDSMFQGSLQNHRRGPIRSDELQNNATSRAPFDLAPSLFACSMSDPPKSSRSFGGVFRGSETPTLRCLVISRGNMHRVSRPSLVPSYLGIAARNDARVLRSVSLAMVYISLGTT
jgi:hypothetical protein